MDYRYNRHLTCAFSLLLLWSLAASAAFAQVTLNSLPTWTGNTRFATSAVSEVRHPSLSLNGFDCGSACSNGHGLKQVLQQGPSSSVGTPIRDVYDNLVDLHNDAIVNTPTTRRQVDQNVAIMQARAFVALATYVLEKNSQSIAGLPTHSTAASLLKTALTTYAAWEFNYGLPEGDDAVKWAGPLSGMARTIDLYLALENAYCYYGAAGDATAQAECNGTTSNRLLSQSQKSDVFLHYANSIQGTEYYGGPGWSPDPLLNGYEAQPGNWPLKVQTAIGAASMVMNSMTAVTPSTFRGYVQRGINASLRTAGTDRHRYFNYQTDDGRRFWAEGPYYFEYALEETIPFWHAIRVNNMFGYVSGYTAPDPFKTLTYTRPLEWLADVATPEGFTPPLDDGNKHPIDVAGLLRWTSSYGTAIVGQKFAWVGDKRGFGPDDNLLLVEIAIPRLNQGQGLAPVAVLGNTTSSQTGEGGEQVVIVRRETTAGACNLITNPGDCHYLLLNAESGDAYGRGEGHEQADQAQLLYYIDGASILMDSGYDQGNGLGNSTWNHYYDHNVLMQATSTGQGGLPPPAPIAAGRKDILVVNPGYLYRTAHGSIDAFHVAQNLPHFITQPNGQQLPADYYREVLFIGGSSPYLIDFNRGKHYQSFGTNPLGDRQFKVAYHVNSNTVQLNNFSSTGTQFVAWTNVGASGKNLYLFPVSMEYPIGVSAGSILSVSDTAGETNGPSVNIKRVDIQDFKMVGGVYRPHFSVASIIQARSGTPSYPPKLLWSSFPTDRYQGWVWKQDANTYDVFVGRSVGDTIVDPKVKTIF